MADKLILTISGEDSDLGDRNVPFAEHYTINCSQEVDITVTETLDSVIRLRSYTASANSEQTANIEMSGLSQGQHTLTITATASEVSVTRVLTFTLPVTYLSPIDADLGDKGEKFTVPYMAKTYSGAELQVTEKLDGEIHREYTAVSGEAQEMTVNTEKLVDTEHTVEIIATGDGETKSAKSVFRVAPIVLSDGGSIQEMQGADGKAVYPATVAKAVMLADGKSVEAKFNMVDMLRETRVRGIESLTIEKIKASTNWIAPKAAGQLFRVFCVGGGGGGGAGKSEKCGGGGGGSGHIEILDLVIAEGEEIAVVCGAGGAGASSSDLTLPGADGGVTSFGELLSAEGGKGGRSASQSGYGKGGDGEAGGGGGGGGSNTGVGYAASAGNGRRYGGGGGGGGSTYTSAVGVGGNGGEYSGGGGGGGARKGSSVGAAGGIGGKFGASGGKRANGGDSPHAIAVGAVYALFSEYATDKANGVGGVGNNNLDSYGYPGSGGGGGYHGNGGNGSVGGGGGGGFYGDGGAGTAGGGGGGGGFFGNGGTTGAGGGGGFFCDGGNGYYSSSAYTGGGGGGGGFFSSGGAADTYSGGAGGNGGVLIMYFKEDEE